MAFPRYEQAENWKIKFELVLAIFWCWPCHRHEAIAAMQLDSGYKLFLIQNAAEVLLCVCNGFLQITDLCKLLFVIKK